MKISSSASIDNIEQDFHEYFKCKKSEDPLLIDMSNIKYIDIVSLVYLISIIDSRFINKYETKIVLPQSSQVNIFLHTWRFLNVIEEITNKHFEHFLDNSKLFFKKVRYDFDGKSFYIDITKDYFSKYYNDIGIKSLVKKGFFSLIYFPFKKNSEKYYAIRKQRIHWCSDKLISDVLEKNISKCIEVGNVLSNTVIAECLYNSAIHPQSDKLVIGSYFDQKSKSKNNKSKHFTIVIWDNGKSIIDTLRASIKRNIKIRSEASFYHALSYKLIPYFRVRYNDNETTIKHDFMPDKKTDDGLVLLSTFLPGITRNPYRELDLFNDRSPGLGLTYLLSAVTDIFEGSISIRTKNYFINIKKSNTMSIEDKEKNIANLYCSAKIVKHDDFFSGNLLTIRIPLKNE